MSITEDPEGENGSADVTHAENGITDEVGTDTQSSLKSKKKKKAQNRKKKQALQRFFKETLDNTKHLVEGIDKQKLESMPPEFNGATFSGALRPYYVTTQVKVPEHIAKPDYAESGIPAGEMEERRSGRRTIHIYTPEEIEIMRDLCRIGREVLDTGAKFLKAGVTGDEIDRIIHQATIDRNGYPSPLNYNSFPKSVCVSVNEVICHGIPDCRPLEEGDIVNLDVSVYKNGYHTDLNETFLIGACDENAVKLVKTAYTCLQLACNTIRPGMMYRDIGQVISKHAAQQSCSVVKTYCGHGVGRQFHTVPNVPHYAKNKAVGIMRPGHIFTIEPMINFGSNWGDMLWPDNWTATTLNGNRSAQFEHTFLVTDTGVEILTARPNAPKDKMVWDPGYIQR